MDRRDADNAAAAADEAAKKRAKKTTQQQQSESDDDDFNGNNNNKNNGKKGSDKEKDKKDKEGGDKRFLPNAGRVDVHPLVLLSLVDHYARVNSRNVVPKRVAGLLLGNYKRQKDGLQVLDINNSFAVPFDYEQSDQQVYFLDTNYAEDMFHMFRKVLPKVQIVGWYSSGPTISSSDMDLHTVVANRFCPNPIYCVVNTDPNNKGVPVLAYTTVRGRGGAGNFEFRNIPTHLGAVEAEEIGIEHLLRDLTDSTITTLSSQLQERELSLMHLVRVLKTTEDYLFDVADGVMPVSEDVLEVLQELVSLQPTIFLHKTSKEMIISANDQAVGLFVAAVARCVGTLHEVILNRRRLARELQELKEKADATAKETEAPAKNTKGKVDNEVTKANEARNQAKNSEKKNDDNDKDEA